MVYPEVANSRRTTRSWRASWGASACLPCKKRPKWCRSAQAANLFQPWIPPLYCMKRITIKYIQQNGKTRQYKVENSTLEMVVALEKCRQYVPLPTWAIIFMKKSNFKFLWYKRKWSSSIQTLTPIHRQEVTFQDEILNTISPFALSQFSVHHEKSPL